MRILFFSFFITIFANVFAQHQLDYYFDDGGYSKVKNEISWEFTQLADLNFSLRYEHYLNSRMSIDIGASLRKGSSAYTEIAIFRSFYLNVFSSKKRLYSYPSSFDAIGGYETWGGIRFYSTDFNRSSYVFLSAGYNFLTNKEGENQRAGFFGFNFGKKIIRTTHFFLGIEFNTRAYIIPNVVNAPDLIYDLSIGYGANIGYKF